MIKSRSPRFCIILKNLSISLLVALLATVCFLWVADRCALANEQEGLRYVFVKVDPAKQAFREEIKSNSDDVPLTKFAKLIDGKHPAVVRIDVEGEENVVYHGSGTLIDVSENRGIVITNWHVIRDVATRDGAIRDGAGKIRVRFPDGFVAEASVLQSDKTWDLAALAIARPRVKPVKLAERIPRIGDALTVIGYGSGTYRQSAGRLLQFCAPGMTEPAEIIEVTTPVRSGDSGGPIFAQDGSLAGVIFGSASGTTNGSHAGRVRMFLDSLGEDRAGVQNATRDGKRLL